MLFEDQNEPLPWPVSPPLVPFRPSFEERDVPLLSEETVEDQKYILEPWAPGLRLRLLPTQNSLSRTEEWVEESFLSWPSHHLQENWQVKTLLELMGTTTRFQQTLRPIHGVLPGDNDDLSDVDSDVDINETGKADLNSSGDDEKCTNQLLAPGPQPQLLASTSRPPDQKRARLDDELHQIDTSSYSQPPEEQSTTKRLPRRGREVRTRKVLPMVFRKDGESLTISACPDSGSDNNIISLSTAERLGCVIEPPRSGAPGFHLANSQSINAVGRVVVDCSFGTGTPWVNPTLTCVFHVFTTLAVPLIMGMQFLEMTETYTKHKDRLVEENSQAAHLIHVNSVGIPRKSLVCQIGLFTSLANADTGSDIDLVSETFAKSRGFKIEEAYHEIMLADGRKVVTCGIMRNQLFTIGLADEIQGFIGKSQPVIIDFFVLPGLIYDVLIGQDTIHELDVFSAHAASFIPSMHQSGEPDINIIRYIGRTERALKGAWSALRGSGGSVDTSKVAVERQWELDDQRENARREARQIEIFRLSGQEQEMAQAEEVEKTRQYEAKKSKRREEDSSAGQPTLDTDSVMVEWSHSPRSTLEDLGISESYLPDCASITSNTSDLIHGNGVYVCTFSGCTAPPFQTQYLLNSHANVHSSARPHYYPVAGCPRSQGGKGFKRKNEMIRHGLIHDVPGYICPFCPDRQHKYPRPDNLQRHVRVHHTNVSKDDPRLREVLSQAPDYSKCSRHFTTQH